ncbi:hypothetical protein [Candidatus Poriferisodalis sp.]|uniref:hypothetical protein n=1 Tax=Candidatus Poriferisodalis sp. TaxID=3101277 RepID=UPI003D12C87B
MSRLNAPLVNQIVVGRFKALRFTHDTEALAVAATVLGNVVDERERSSDGAIEGRVFGRIMDLGANEVPQVAMLAMLALAPQHRRWPSAGILVDEIGTLQDQMDPTELSELMRNAATKLRDEAGIKTAAEVSQ